MAGRGYTTLIALFPLTSSLYTAIAPYARSDTAEEFCRLTMTFATSVGIGDIAIGNLQNMIEGFRTLVDSLTFALAELIPDSTEDIVGHIGIGFMEKLFQLVQVELDQLDTQFISNFNCIVHDAAIIDQDGSLAVEIVHHAIKLHHHTAGDLGLAVAKHFDLDGIAFAVFLCKHVYSPVG